MGQILAAKDGRRSLKVYLLIDPVCSLSYLISVLCSTRGLQVLCLWDSVAWMGLFLSITLAGICYAIFLALLTSPFISIFQKCDEICHLLWSPLSFSLSLCLYHFYSFILILVRFWEKAETKVCVQFAIFNQKSSPAPINYSTNCNLTSAPLSAGNNTSQGRQLPLW